MLNHIIIMGRLTRDPELRYTQSGTAVTSFTLAVDRDFTSHSSSEKQSDFIDIVAWRKTAEFVSRYFSKGRLVIVSGRIQVRSRIDHDGNRHRVYEVIADTVYFGDSRKYQNADNVNVTKTYMDPAAVSEFKEIDGDDKELPF